MKTENPNPKPLRSGFVRFAAMFALLLVAGKTWGQSVAPINPKHVEWQKRQEVNSETPSNGGTRRGVRSTPDDEVSQFTFGYVPGLIDKSYLQALNVTTPYGLATSTLPSSYDQRALDHLTAVRDQGRYGTCWAHSTMGALETLLKVQGKGDSDFSEKHMANTHGWSGALAGGWTGVFGDGAWAETAMAYLVRWSGPIAEDDDPYPSDYYKDNGIPVPPSPENPMVLGHVQNFMGIVPMPQPDNFRLSDTYDIKNAVMQHGSVRASYTHIWGAMTRDRKNHYWDGDSDSIDANGGGGHSVLIVGWDDNYPKSNFKKTPPGNGAFIAKNSWGTSFGENGYFYISYYDCTFGRDELHAIPDLEPTNNFGDIYQYDPLGWVNNFGGNSMTMWGANVFTARKHDILDAIGFYATAPNTRYELSIYTGCSSSNPTSGNRAYSASGSVPFFGYVTVPLSQGVDIATGQRFSIVLKLTTPGNSYPLPIEYATAVSMDATASRGQSFFSDNGTSWTDFTTWNSTANFCCKAYTKSATAAKPKLASIAIISDTASLKPGDRIQLKCDATYDNNSKSNVTEAAQWSLTTGQNYATISSSGMLTGKNVAVPEPQTITVQAIYTEDGISATNKFGFSMAATPPEPPTDMTASQGTETSCVRVNWTTPAGATEYAVYRAVANSSKNAQYLDKVTVAKYNDTSATPGVDYWYFVKAKNSSGASDFSAGAHGWRALAAPTDVVASDGTSEEAVSVSWSSAAGASAYRVYRADSFDGEYEPKTGWISATEWVDTSVEPGDTYWYSVVAAVDSAGNRPSDYSIPDDGFRAVPVLPESLVIEGDASVSSGGNASYSAYVEYSDGHRGDTPVSPTWSVSGGSVSRTGAVTAPVVSANTEITLSAHTTVEGATISGTKTILVTATVPDAPAGLRVVSATAAGGVSLAWDAAFGASGYKVFRTANGANETSFASSTASFTDTTAIPGLLYAYAVAAENAAGTGARSAAVEVRIPLAAPTGVSATKDRTDCVRVAWAAVAGATHYRVSRATSASGAKTDLGSSWTAALSFDDTTAAAGTTNTYFVRAATSAAGANAGDYSAGVEGVRKPSRTLVSLSVSGPDRVPASGEAVYSCTANWSDGTAETVSPSWAASPSAAGGIDADGKFVAAAVTADTTATITANYSGKTGTKIVTVVAPIPATAEITAITAAQRWPFTGLVDIDYTLATAPAGTRASVSVSATDEDHNVALPATTLSGDGASGPVEAGSHRITWNLAADHPGFHAAALAVSLSAVPAVTIEVAFDGNGGTPSQSFATYTVGDAYGTLPTATRTGYAFDGWFTAVTGGTRVTESTPADENVTTLHAHWTANTYTIHFDANGGTGSMADMVVAYDVTTNLAANAFANAGHVFAGWAASADGAVVHADGASVANLSATNGAEVRLYAVWQLLSLSMTIDGVNSVSAGLSATYSAIVTMSDGTSRQVTPIWSCAGNGSYGNIDSGGTFTAAQTGIAGSETIQASYTEHGISVSATKTIAITTIPATITFNGNGGNVETPSSVYTRYATYGTLPTATRAGYTFNGWWTSASGGSLVPTWSTVSTTRTLYAHWLNGDTIQWEISNGKLTSVSLNGATSVTIPATVNQIGNDVFLGANAMTSISIPQSVTNIGYRAFAYCRGLTSLTIPPSVKVIGAEAFLVCSNLTSLTLSGGIEYLGSCAFGKCDKLARVSIPTTLQRTMVGTFYFNGQDIRGGPFAGCDSLTSASIAYGADVVGNNLFCGCTNLTNVTIPSTVTNIGYQAFAGCAKLRNLTLPANLKSITEDAFYGCDALIGTTTIPGVRMVGEWVVGYDESARGHIDLSSIKGIASAAFNGCSGITSIRLPSNWTEIGERVFYGFEGLSSVEIPSAVTRIGERAFSGCSNLVSVAFPSGLNVVEDYAFEKCGIRNLVLPSSVSDIRQGAFYYCHSLTNAVIYDGIAEIRNLTFFYCDNLLTVSIPYGVTNIMSQAFGGCSRLKSIDIPDSVLHIGFGAFQGCKTIEEFHIPRSVVNLDDGWNGAVFGGCSSLIRFVVDEGNPAFKSINGALYNKQGSELICCPGSWSRIEVPLGVTDIARSAFTGCGYLTSIVLPESVTNIKHQAFNSCNSLTSVTVQSPIVHLELGAFVYCPLLRQIMFLGQLDNYNIDVFGGSYSTTPNDLVICVTSAWTGPTDTWYGRSVVVQ